MKKVLGLLLLTVMISVSAQAGVFSFLKRNKKTKNEFAWYAPAPHPYFEEVKAGIEAFEAESGVKFIKQVGPDWTQQSQSQNIEALAAKGVKFFTVYPADPSGANGLYEELAERDVKVVNFGAPTLLPTDAKFLVGTDIKKSAMDATEELIAMMGYKGNIINVLEVMEDANTITRKEGVEEVVAKYPDVKIIQEISGMTSVEEATQKVQDALAANIQKVDGIIATGFTPSVGIATALSDYYDGGGKREIRSILIDTHPIVMKAIEDGYVTGTIAQNPFGHGYLSASLLYLMSQGKTPKDGAYFTNAGVAVVTKDNITTYPTDIKLVTESIKAELENKYFK